MIELILGIETGVLLTLGVAAGVSYLSRRRATRQVVSQIEASRASAQKAADDLVGVIRDIAAMSQPGKRPVETATIIPYKKETQNDPKS